MEVSNADQQLFQDNVELQLQQGEVGNPLEEAVVWTDDASAEKIKVKDIFAAKRAKSATERNGKTVWDDPDNDGVWLPKTDELYEAILIENADKLKTAISLEGASTMITAATLNRAKIRRVLEGFAGPIISGKSGTVSTPLGTQGQVAATVGGASGDQPLNIKKIRQANVYLKQGFNPKYLKRYMVVTAEDCDALLDEVNATSEDFKKTFGAKYDADGNLIGILGFNFIEIELDDPDLDTIPDLYTSGTNRINPFWVKGGLVGNYWQRLRSHIGKLPERRFNEGTLGGTTLAATRTQPGRCGFILNKKQ
ncbi:MAG: phage capsid protein [Pseudomonadota bacterium]